MAKAPKGSGGPVDVALRKAFRAVETQRVPPVLADHLEQLAAPKRRPDRRS